MTDSRGLPNREGLGTKRKTKYPLATTLGGVQCRWNGETCPGQTETPHPAQTPEAARCWRHSGPTPACSLGAELHSGHRSATAQTPATEEYTSATQVPCSCYHARCTAPSWPLDCPSQCSPQTLLHAVTPRIHHLAPPTLVWWRSPLPTWPVGSDRPRAAAVCTAHPRLSLLE